MGVQVEERWSTGRRRLDPASAARRQRVMKAPASGWAVAHHASTRRWMRSMARARPVAGSMWIRTALKMTVPSPDLEPRWQRIDEPRDDRPRLEPDDAPDRPGHPKMGLVRGAVGRIRSSPVTTCVCVPTTALTLPSRWSPRAFWGDHQLAVEVDDFEPEAAARMSLVEERVGVGERVLDLLHIRPALEIDPRRCPCHRAPGGSSQPRPGTSWVP